MDIVASALLIVRWMGWKLYHFIVWDSFINFCERDSFGFSIGKQLVPIISCSPILNVATITPCTVSVLVGLHAFVIMRDAALLARDKGVFLHTHLAENDEDIAYSLEKFGCRPGQYAEDLGWTGADVWHAHCVQLDHEEIGLFARTQTGVAHCPCSNGRLGSGIAPITVGSIMRLPNLQRRMFLIYLIQAEKTGIYQFQLILIL